MHLCEILVVSVPPVKSNGFMINNDLMKIYCTVNKNVKILKWQAITRKKKSLVLLAPDWF